MNTRRLTSALILLASLAARPALAGTGMVTIDLNKFYDSNANGQFDDEPPQRGVTIAIKYTPPGGTQHIQTVVTDMTGFAWVMIPAGSSFTVCERIPMTTTPGVHWVQTMPNAGTSLPGVSVIQVGGQYCYSGTAPLTGGVAVSFGNVCIGGEGHTPGFWSNNNGEAILAANDPGWRNVLNALNLRDLAGNNFDVPGGSFATAYLAFRTWLLGSDAVNMSYKLSSHLAASVLNVTYGFVPAGSSVYAPGTQSANSAGFANVLDLFNEANAELAIHGTALSGDAWRSYQEALKNAFQSINEGGNFAQSTPCNIDCP
jgi:hypothetical protein